jgi:hypothetical protein
MVYSTARQCHHAVASDVVQREKLAGVGVQCIAVMICPREVVENKVVGDPPNGFEVVQRL